MSNPDLLVPHSLLSRRSEGSAIRLSPTESVAQSVPPPSRVFPGQVPHGLTVSQPIGALRTCAARGKVGISFDTSHMPQESDQGSTDEERRSRALFGYYHPVPSPISRPGNIAMVGSSEGLSDLILGALESREAFRKALARNSSSQSTEDRCANHSEKGPQSVVEQGASDVKAEQDGSRRRRRIDDEDSGCCFDSPPCDSTVLERMHIMISELARKPTDSELIALAKAQIRDGWYTKDGSTFYYRNMETGLPDASIPSVDASFVVLAAELALRNLFLRRSLFDSMLLPQLEQVMKNQGLSEEDKIEQMVFLRHHSPVALRPKVGRLLKDVPFANSFVFHWELYHAEKSDVLLDTVLKDLHISSVSNIPL